MKTIITNLKLKSIIDRVKVYKDGYNYIASYESRRYYLLAYADAGDITKIEIEEFFYNDCPVGLSARQTDFAKDLLYNAFESEHTYQKKLENDAPDNWESGVYGYGY